jgi:DNA-binding NarL/FixJ family response regulator
MKPIPFALFDDHQISAHAFKRLLRDIYPLKFIFKAHTKNALLESLKDQCPEVLFVSYPFGHNESEDAIQQAKIICSGLKVLVLSHTITSEKVMQLIDDGANCILPKSASIGDLEQAVTELGDKEHSFTELFSQAMFNELKKRKVFKNHSSHEKLKLTDKKIAIINYLFQEHSHKEIASKMVLQLKSIDTYVTNMIHEVGARNVVGLVKYGIKHNLIKDFKNGNFVTSFNLDNKSPLSKDKKEE